MPEGDAVFRTARRLDRALRGQALVATDFRVPQLATVDLAGARVEMTTTHGKHLLTRLVRGEERWTLHTHLKMEGTWRVFEPGRRWSRPAHEARVVLRTGRLSAVGFALGVVELLPSEQEDTVVGHLGPDLLDPAWGPTLEAEALRRLAEDPHRLLGAALLDQTRLAGIGTIYLAESCFLTGAHPLSAVGEVRDLARVVRKAHQLLAFGAAHSRPVFTGDRNEPTWVYGRTGRRCRRCGTVIEAGQLGDAGRERTTYWCPRCQPLG